MRQNCPGQLVELERSWRAGGAAVAEAEQEAENPVRETKVVVSGWVREHKHRSEEYRRAFKDLLMEEGFISSPTTSRDGSSGK